MGSIDGVLNVAHRLDGLWRIGANQRTISTMLTIYFGAGIDASIVNDVTSEDQKFFIFFKVYQMMSLLLASSWHMPRACQRKANNLTTMLTILTGTVSMPVSLTTSHLRILILLSSSRTFKWCHFFLHPLGVCPCTTRFKILISVWINIHLVLLIADQSASPEYVTLFSKNLSVWITVVGWGNFKLEKKVEKLQMRLEAILKVVSWSTLKCGELISFC